MKVVHINFSDSEGGAGIAAYRHFEAMRKAGIDASMLVLRKKKQSNLYIYSCYNGKLAKLMPFFKRQLMKSFLFFFNPWGAYSFPFYNTSISNHPAVKNADIIYIHWVAASMLTTSEIERILKLGKPVRWYMHDMNPITGGCHYAMECEQYKTECKTCPYLNRHPLGINLSYTQFHKRLKCWNKYSNLEAFTPSKWLGKCVEQSTIWKGHRITIFPNVLDINKFHPIDKKIARNILNISSTKKIVLFGAASINSPYKGWKYMLKALNKLEPNFYEAIVFGEEDILLKKDLNIHCNFTGYLHDEYSLILAYNAADVFVSSSVADNYPNVILESMACGLPCVGFNIGGIPDMIKHKQNGFLSQPNNSESLVEGIKYVCEIPKEDYNLLSEGARAFVCKNASYDVYKKFK